MVENPENLRTQARLIASSEKGPKAVWSDLQQWASRKGPVALKLAMVEFISCQGSSPEAALIIPQFFKAASFSPAEKKDLLQFAKSNNSIPSALSLAPKLRMSSEKLSLTFKKDPAGANYTVGNNHLVKPVEDHSSMRDIHLMMHDKSKLTLDRPSPGAIETPKFDSSKSPDTLFVSAPSHKGEHLVRQLTDKLRSHGRDPQYPVSGISGTVKAAAKTKSAAKKVPKKKPSKKTMKKAVKRTKKVSKKPQKKKSKR